MKTLKRSITVLVCFILFASCTKSIDGKKEKSNIEVREEITYYKDKPFTGEIFENYENGQLQYKNNFKDGKQVENETYYENGQLQFKINVKDGIEDGLYETYYENGQLEYKANYINGKKNGLYETYYENGQLEYKANYINGKKNGLFEWYDENGQLNYKENYKDGISLSSEH